MDKREKMFTMTNRFQSNKSEINTNLYCNQIVYLYNFWYMTTIYILLDVCLIDYIFALIYNSVNKQQEKR
jgi:hypothetical protein